MKVEAKIIMCHSILNFCKSITKSKWLFPVHFWEI